MPTPRAQTRCILALFSALALGGAVLATGPAPAQAAPGAVFARLASYPVFQNTGLGPETEAVAEISAASADGRTVVYTDAANGLVGFLDISDPAAPIGQGTLTVGGSPTSVAVVGGLLLICVDDTEDLTAPAGRLVVADLATRATIAEIDLSGQPDSIAITDDGSLAAIAMENQRDEEITVDGVEGGLPQLPAGFLNLLDLSGPATGWTPAAVDLVPALTAIDAYGATDPETEYVSFDADGLLALTLQENNAVAIIDPDRASLADSPVTAFDAGSVAVADVDVIEDDTIDPSGSTEVIPREPDSIAWVGPGLVATANEGDLLGGTRGWTVFAADPDAVGFGDVVYDSGNSLETLAISQGLYPESRSEDKGAELEGMAFDVFDGVPYAFVGSERGNFVAVYDMTDPADPAYVQTLPTTNGPEGLLAIPARGLFVVSSETDVPEDDVRASVAIHQLGTAPPQFPTIASTDSTDGPVAWGALSGLSGAPGAPGTLYGVSDSYYSPAEIQTIDVAASPAQVTSALEVDNGAVPWTLDLEGIAARTAGGWWAVSEGDPDEDRPNELLAIDPTGVVTERIELPAEIADALGANGLEGVTVVPGAGAETVWVAVQVPAEGDPAGVTRLGRYDVAAGTWSWVGYQLEPTPAGGTEFVSEVVAVDADTLAVIERDNRPGVFAEIKRIYTVELRGITPAATGAPLPIAPKTLAVDVLPLLGSTGGWVQEKLEGLAIGADGAVYAVTDNDGVEDATGETVFLRLGPIFGVGAGPGVPPAPGPVPPGGGSPTPAPDLAATGTAVDGLLPLAAGLLLTGLAATMLGRRRRTR